VGFDNLVPLRRFYGPLIPDIYAGSLGFTGPEITGLATEGWRRATVLKPNVDLNQTIAELRDFKSMLFGVRNQLRKLFELSTSGRGFFRTNRQILKEIASGHLSWQFAILPLIQDIIGLQNAHAHAEKRMQQLLRDKGKTRHRTIELVNETTSGSWDGTISVQPITPTVPSQQLVNNGADTPRHEEWTRTRRVWLEGRFGYHIPVRNTPAWKHWFLVQQGYGVNLTTIGLLRTVYQLTPWSWLADWALSTGAMLQNAVSVYNYGAYAKYAYIMAEDEIVYKTSYSLTPHIGQKIDVPGEFTSVRKYRQEASPFGFGISYDGLNAWQLGILAALGMSKYG
jgi:hypothetical protein